METVNTILLVGILAYLLNIDRKVDRVMAQIDDLNAALAGIATDVDQVVADHATLEQELADLQTQLQNAGSPVDLTNAITQAQAIKAKLDAISSAASTPPAPTPAP